MIATVMRERGNIHRKSMERMCDGCNGRKKSSRNGTNSQLWKSIAAGITSDDRLQVTRERLHVLLGVQRIYKLDEISGILIWPLYPMDSLAMVS